MFSSANARSRGCRNNVDGRPAKSLPASACRLLSVAAICLALIFLSACKSNVSEYRFEMTVEVETPDGLKTGSSVYAVRAGNKTRLTSEEGTRSLSQRGEAVAVDVAPGKTLFALLKTNAHWGDVASLSMQALDPRFTKRYDSVGTAARLAARDATAPPAIVDPAIYPMLVTFTDIDDPTSVQLVDPDDLAATFGDGYALKRITVRITDAPVTTEIERRLGWLETVGKTRGTLVENPPRLLKDAAPKDFITPGEFSTEIWK
ncbi:MAG: hypothetical protein KDE55_07980 [Novosphingobium sp.]|nr:hypothetical protein [Novosphingobium sp.]